MRSPGSSGFTPSTSRKASRWTVQPLDGTTRSSVGSKNQSTSPSAPEVSSRRTWTSTIAITGGNGTSTRSLTVNMIRVVLDGLLDGEAIAGSATSEVDVRPLGSTCACPADDDTVSGEAYGAFVDVLDTDLGRNPDAILSSQGGRAEAQVLGLNVTTLLSSGTVTSTTIGALTPAGATSQSAPLFRLRPR